MNGGGSNIECCNKKFVGVCTRRTLPAAATTRKSCSSPEVDVMHPNPRIHSLLKTILVRHQQARKPRSYASLKLCPLTYSVTGVKCRATSVAKKTGSLLLLLGLQRTFGGQVKIQTCYAAVEFNFEFQLEACLQIPQQLNLQK